MQLLEAIRKAAQVRGLVELKFASEAEIHALNAKFRGKPKVTDLLSFPSTLGAEEAQSVAVGEPLGLIVLCERTVERRCKGLFKKFPWMRRERRKKLLVHGFAHLLHYDHHSVVEHAKMRNFENFILKQL